VLPGIARDKDNIVKINLLSSELGFDKDCLNALIKHLGNPSDLKAISGISFGSIGLPERYLITANLRDLILLAAYMGLLVWYHLSNTANWYSISLIDIGDLKLYSAAHLTKDNIFGVVKKDLYNFISYNRSWVGSLTH
jgi:hypothetical protein